jgi:hypothetical protein
MYGSVSFIHHKIEKLLKWLNHSNIYIPVAVKILSKNDSLYNEAAKLDIDMSKLNDLKNFSDRNKNIWLGFKDKTLNSNTLLDFINYTQNDMQKLETEFKHPNEDEMTKIAKYIYGK